MNDPHVESLRYRLVPDERTTFSERAAPVEAETEAFAVRLDHDGLTVTMREHYATQERARAAVDPYLLAWEVRHAIRVGGVPEFRFEFDRAEVVDRDPPPPGTPQTVTASASITARAVISATASVERGSFPQPPTDFVLDANALTLWQRWQGYLAGREPLQTMTYFCLTVLQLHDGRAGAATRYGVSGRVLSRLARLSSEVGDGATARKATANPRPLTDSESRWLEQAAKLLVQRAGEVAADPTAARSKITMADLPPL